MINYSNPYADLPEMPSIDELPEKEQKELRLKTLFYGCLSKILALLGGLLLCAIFSGCAAPKVIEQHHHHHYEADTLALQSLVDTRLSSWQVKSEVWFRQLVTEESAKSSSQSDEREVTTETVTTATDSLGRVIRTEQRRTERFLSQQQQQQEQRIILDYEQRLRSVVDSINAEWESRYEALQAHIAQADSASIHQQPAEVKPWYRRLFGGHLLFLASMILAAAVLWQLIKRKW